MPSGSFQISGADLTFQSNKAAPVPAWSDEEWKGESFRLSFELRIDELDPGRNLSVGFMRRGVHVDANERYLVARVGSTSGQFRSVSVAWRNGDDATRRGAIADPTPGRGLPLGAWYRFVLSYDAPSRRAWLAVREAAAPHHLYGAMDVEAEALSEGPLHLAAGAGHVEDDSNSSYRIRNVAISRP